MVDFLLCLPEVMKSTLDRKKVIGGFLNAGFVDSDTKKWPDFDGMLRTAGTKLTRESYDLILSSFPKLHKEQLRKGRLSDKEDFIPNFFPEDKYPFGAKPVDRDSEYESYQRCKTLNAKYQIDLRKEKRRVIDNHKKDKKEARLIIINSYLDDNTVVEGKLKSLLSSIATDESTPVPNVLSFHQLEMSHFASTRGIVIKHLKAFCICRKFTNETFPRNNKPNGIPSLKKDLAELAHSLRTSEITMIRSSTNDDDDTSTGSVDLTNVDDINTLDNDPDILNNNRRLNLNLFPTFAQTSQLLPIKNAATYLNDVEWRKKLVMEIKGVRLMEHDIAVENDVCQNANTCVSLLMHRYEPHFISRRVASKMDHYAFKWAKRNFHPMVAAMSYFGHMKQKLNTVKSDLARCLLSIPMSVGVFLDARNESKKELEGCYLYFDEIEYRWIRSGKAAGRGSNFGIRDDQHAKAAKDPNNNGSEFYRKYPDDSLADFNSSGKRSHLQQYCGLAFERGNTSQLTSKDGVFIWDDVTMKELEKIKGNDSIENVQLNMLAYLFEFVYDLCIGSDGVSESAGFERIAHTYQVDH